MTERLLVKDMIRLRESYVGGETERHSVSPSLSIDGSLSFSDLGRLNENLETESHEDGKLSKTGKY